jgi:hypothetical protein
MTKYACITSVSQDYYDHCGKACIETFSNFWPDDITLHVYNEDMEKPKKKKKVEYMPWHNLHWFPDFARRTENKNVIKFSKKAFSIIHALENIDCDRLIWLDADTVTTRNITHLFLDLIAPADVLSTHFRVRHEWPSDTDPSRFSYSCETGFFIVNKRHPMVKEMTRRYKEYYLNDLGYALRRFYDGEVYGAVVDEMASKGAKMLDLNPDLDIKTPMPRSVIDPYITHFKAGRKDNLNNNELLKNIPDSE